jgi:hypothetical protein
MMEVVWLLPRAGEIRSPGEAYAKFKVKFILRIPIWAIEYHRDVWAYLDATTAQTRRCGRTCIQITDKQSGLSWHLG